MMDSHYAVQHHVNLLFTQHIFCQAVILLGPQLLLWNALGLKRRWRGWLTPELRWSMGIGGIGQDLQHVQYHRCLGTSNTNFEHFEHRASLLAMNQNPALVFRTHGRIQDDPISIDPIPSRMPLGNMSTVDPPFSQVKKQMFEGPVRPSFILETDTCSNPKFAPSSPSGTDAEGKVWSDFCHRLKYANAAQSRRDHREATPLRAELTGTSAAAGNGSGKLSIPGAWPNPVSSSHTIHGGFCTVFIYLHLVSFCSTCREIYKGGKPRQKPFE